MLLHTYIACPVGTHFKRTACWTPRISDCMYMKPQNVLLNALLPSTFTGKNVFRPYVTWVLLKRRLVALAKGKKKGQKHNPQTLRYSTVPYKREMNYNINKTIHSELLHAMYFPIMQNTTDTVEKHVRFQSIKTCGPFSNKWLETLATTGNSSIIQLLLYNQVKHKMLTWRKML